MVAILNEPMFSNIREEALFHSSSIFYGFADVASISRDHTFLSTNGLMKKENGAGIRLVKDGN